jgi:hypothetical protein
MANRVLKTPHLTNVQCTMQHGAKVMLVSFAHANARYHVWIDPDSLDVQKGAGCKTPSLYKNPPLGVKQFQPEYFYTRKLDCSRGPSKLLVDAAMRVVREDGLVDKARQAAEQDAKDQVAAEEEWQINERADKRVRDAAYEMLATLTQILVQYDAGLIQFDFPACPSVDRARRAIQLAGEGVPQDTDPVGAKMPDGSVQTPWDERLRAAGGAPIYAHNQRPIDPPGKGAT